VHYCVWVTNVARTINNNVTASTPRIVSFRFVLVHALKTRTVYRITAYNDTNKSYESIRLQVTHCYKVLYTHDVKSYTSYKTMDQHDSFSDADAPEAAYNIPDRRVG